MPSLCNFNPILFFYIRSQAKTICRLFFFCLLKKNPAKTRILRLTQKECSISKIYSKCFWVHLNITKEKRNSVLINKITTYTYTPRRNSVSSNTKSDATPKSNLLLWILNTDVELLRQNLLKGACSRKKRLGYLSGDWERYRKRRKAIVR